MTPRSLIHEAINSSQRFLIASHVSPDGDAIGSMIALAHLLRSLGKECLLYNPSGLPERFAWLQSPFSIQAGVPTLPVDWAIVLDCGDLERAGSELPESLDASRIINIDHHQGNPEFGRINWVEPDRSSVGEMVGLLAQDLGISLGGPLGEALYLALVTDTGSFSYSNTSPETLRLAADILAEGLDLDRFNASLQGQWSLAKVHLHGKAMQQASLAAGGRVGVIRVDGRMLQETGATLEDCEGLVNSMRQVKGVLVSLSLREEDAGIKFSLRSWGDVDVQAIALHFGGGGHVNAAGGSIASSLADAEQRLVQAIAPYLPDKTAARMSPSLAATWHYDN
jgi:phosphoesterase RecJ-like protein